MIYSINRAIVSVEVSLWHLVNGEELAFFIAHWIYGLVAD